MPTELFQASDTDFDAPPDFSGQPSDFLFALIIATSRVELLKILQR